MAPKSTKVQVAAPSAAEQPLLDALARLGLAREELKTRLVNGMFAGDYAEARRLMDEMRNEPHVQLLRPARVEIEFLEKRERQLKDQLAQLIQVSEVANG